MHGVSLEWVVTDLPPDAQNNKSIEQRLNQSNNCHDRVSHRADISPPSQSCQLFPHWRKNLFFSGVFCPQVIEDCYWVCYLGENGFVIGVLEHPSVLITVLHVALHQEHVMVNWVRPAWDLEMPTLIIEIFNRLQWVPVENNFPVHKQHQYIEHLENFGVGLMDGVNNSLHVSLCKFLQ